MRLPGCRVGYGCSQPGNKISIISINSLINDLLNHGWSISIVYHSGSPQSVDVLFPRSLDNFLGVFDVLEWHEVHDQIALSSLKRTEYNV